MRKFQYDNLPSTNKHTFLINSRKINTEYAYRQSLRWTRHMATTNGVDMDLITFECIRTMKVDDDGHELMELAIKFSGKCLKLVILRENLKILGFVVPELDRKFQLKTDDYEIEGFTPITGDFNLSYGSRPLKSFGIGPMVKAMYELTGTDINPSVIADLLEVFYIHFMEAARFNILEVQIARTMKLSTVPFLPQRDVNDIRWLYEERFETKTDGFVVLPDFVRHILMNFEHLSTAWSIYVLSGKRYSVWNASLAQKCRIREVESLGSILRLVKPNVESVKRVLCEMSKDDYEEVEEILEVLK